MINPEDYLGSYSEGRKPIFCAACNQPIAGRHHSNHRLEKGSDSFFCILTKIHHGLKPGDMDTIRRRLQGLGKAQPRTRKAQTVPKIQEDKE